MRRLMSTGLAAMLTVALTGVGGSAAQAAGDPADTPCTAELTVDLDPGVSLQPSSGSFHTQGQDGSLTCSGPVDGQTPVAGGKGGAVGRYGIDAPNSCSKLDGKLEFTITASLPTEHGQINFTDHGTGEYGPGEGSWFFGGSFKGQKTYGTYKLTPVGGDCLVRPVRQLYMQVTAWVVNGKADTEAASRMTLTR